MEVGGGGGRDGDLSSELSNFFQVLVLAMASLSYCYYIASRIPTGLFRLLSVLPVIYIFIILPLRLSSANIGGLTAFLLVWLANFKLLLFSVNQGPLSPPPPNLFHFISVACLPIKIKPPSNSSSSTALKKNTNDHVIKKAYNHKTQQVLLVVKVVLLGLIYYALNYKQNFHMSFILVLYCCNMYLQLELLLLISAAPARALFGFELEPQFNEPYLTTSLQDFWGHRWNLMVTSILRPTVYYPIRRISTRLIGSMLAHPTAVMASFVVSGLMHEVMYYYITRVPPTWEVFWFFVLHGVCLVVEGTVKRAFPGKLPLLSAVYGPLAVVFLAVTSVWLFWPQLLRSGVDDKVIAEFFMTLDFVKKKVLMLMQFWHEK